MPTDELIRAIERAEAESIQDLMDAVFRRYRELFPQWEILYFALEKARMKEKQGQIAKLCKLICEEEENRRV